MLLLAAGCTNLESTSYRGREVDREVLRTEKWEGFSFQLAPSENGRPRLLISHHELVNYYEVPVYQKVLELKAPDETNREKVQHRVAEGEVIRGDPTTRNEKTDLGPWANEPFLLNGVPVKSDATGSIVDADELLLGPFDDLARTRLTLTLAHARVGQVRLDVERDELLRSLGLRLSDLPTSRSSRDELRLKIDAPARLAPGKPLVLKLHVQNASAMPAVKVTCRTVSRHAWLDGRTFYFGDLNGGATRSFARTVVVPADGRKGPVFGAIGVWDLLGAVPDKAVPLTFTVE
jgi:hypothetical protein